ncbi:MAG: glycosyl hydrolase 115 family protein, partial [Lachnospiraceae bacterium]|nr:glycosyl hydrolase 115 family protein [Lachnospiraceae bacterium]
RTDATEKDGTAGQPETAERAGTAGQMETAERAGPAVQSETAERADAAEGPKTTGNGPVVLIATCGFSRLLDMLEQEGAVCLDGVREKREVYGIYLAQSARFPKGLLVIAGSDKRGTIYGMFCISEKIGVSPWVFWADAVPKRRKEIVFGEEICTVSKEPSVKYRGFFINDEQPCFGNWAKEKYGSVKPGPELYRHIFELLLRLKGNYLWPAMWRSDFTLDHLENAELADRMGVIIGASHHEPCCRSGGEFQKLRHQNKAYGEHWSFLSNPEGISEFWKDGLLRNQKFESLITIGMRGENDSYLMPADATLQDNINVLKAAITEQKRLIAEYGNRQHPQLLALYKEVEDYYHGDENTPGLKDWDVLKDDILMLCDDNFGNVRTLPGKEAEGHPGGYGMYYHFDYYGGPVSYLWINSTPLTKIWEQMTMAYDFGVREAWIVNVGDIKNQELPLSYFLDLAYDFDAWGTESINRTSEYTRAWLHNLGFTEPCFDGAAELLEEYTSWNGSCRPEVLRADTYHPAHGREADRMLDRVSRAAQRAEELRRQAEKGPLADCFYELVYYPVAASANVIEMQLSAGLNHFYVSQRKKKGNRYPARIRECIRRDRELAEEYHGRNGSKWNKMQSVFHIGYPGWNDEEWQYPEYRGFYPVCAPRLLVSVDGQDECTGGNPWRRKTLDLTLSDPAKPEGGFEVSNGGEGVLKYRIVWDADWIDVFPVSEKARGIAGEAAASGNGQGSENQKNPESGKVFEVREGSENVKGSSLSGETESDEGFVVRLKPGAMPKPGEQCTGMIRIYGDNCEETAERSENGYSETRVDIRVQADSFCPEHAAANTFVETDGVLSVEAPHFTAKKAAGQAEWRVIEGYGKTLGGIKVFPVTSVFSEPEEAPSVTYSLFVKEAGEYTLELYTSPGNPVIYQGKLRVAVRANRQEFQLVNTIPDEGYVPWQSGAWAKGVLEQIHRTSCRVRLEAGSNTLCIAAADPAVVLEKLVLTREKAVCPKTYLGPAESFCTGRS